MPKSILLSQLALISWSVGVYLESGCSEWFGAEGRILPPDGQILYVICYVNMRMKSCLEDNKNKPEGFPYVLIMDQGKMSYVNPQRSKD